MSDFADDSFINLTLLNILNSLWYREKDSKSQTGRVYEMLPSLYSEGSRFIFSSILLYVDSNTINTSN